MKSEDLIEMAEFLHETVTDLKAKITCFMADVNATFKRVRPTGPDAVDLGYLLKRVAEDLDEMRKEVDARKRLCDLLICETCATDMMNGGVGSTIVRGKIATGDPDIKSRPKLPAPGTDAYAALLRWCGVDNPLVIKSGAVSFSWSRTSNLVADMMAQGMEAPGGLLETYPEAQVTYRATKKKD